MKDKYFILIIGLVGSWIAISLKKHMEKKISNILLLYVISYGTAVIFLVIAVLLYYVVLRR
jgi:uncharacterized membrane protein YeaQ/YmgE (transglycosylase-associated protein family)